MIYLILFFGLILRLILLGQSFWLDEAISAITASKPFPYQIFGITGDFQPPLYYVILHLWMKSGLTAEWFLRIPSVGFGLLSVYFLYALVRQLLGKNTALKAAMLLAGSQFQIYYSQELRMYSLLCLLSILSITFLVRRQWVRLSIVIAAGLLTNYMFFFMIPVQLIYIFRDRKEFFRKWLVTVSASLGIFLFWIPQFMQQLNAGNMLVSVLPAWKTLSAEPLYRLLPQLFLKFTWGRVNFPDKFLYSALFLFLGVLYIIVLFPLRKMIKKNAVRLFMLWFVIPLALSLLFSLLYPVANVWRLIFLQPPFLVLTSMAVTLRKKGNILFALLVMIGMCSNLFYWTDPQYQREKWRDAVQYMEAADSPIVFTAVNGFAPFLWYKKSNQVICSKMDTGNCLRGKYVIYADYLRDLFDPEGEIKSFIEKDYKEKEVRDFPGVGFVTLYENSH